MIKEKNIEKDILAKLAEEIQKEIDSGLMYAIYLESGWTPIILPNNFSFNRSMLYSVIDWLNENCKAAWFQYDQLNFCFKEEKDAIVFALRWL